MEELPQKREGISRARLLYLKFVGYLQVTFDPNLFVPQVTQSLKEE